MLDLPPITFTPPLAEAQRLITSFLGSDVTTELDLKRLSQLIEVGEQEIEILKNEIKKQ